MDLEIEKKYELTKSDLAIIQEKFELISEEEIKDYYLDDKKLTLFKNNYHLRIRNGLYELKIDKFDKNTQTSISEEYIDEDEINKKLKKFKLNIDDTSGVLFIGTNRENYKTQYKQQELTICIDKFQYGERYEIEILLENFTGDKKEKLEELEKIIAGFRLSNGLTGGTPDSALKILTCAMHQNIDLYEILAEK